MHIYAFGSLCRGDVDRSSDIDLLAITEGFDARLDPEVFSIYSPARIRTLWGEGNPFAWHLAKEAKLIFASDGRDMVQAFGTPAPYSRCLEDCKKFLLLYEQAASALEDGSRSSVFELSTIFLAIRNFATCFALGTESKPDFSRHSARRLGPRSIKISDGAYRLLERSRMLSSRGVGTMVSEAEAKACLHEIFKIGSWMRELLEEIPGYA